MPMIAQITIAMDDHGKVEVTCQGVAGDNKTVGYGLLEVAKEVIAQSFAERQRLVQPATTEAAAAFGGRKGN